MFRQTCAFQAAFRGNTVGLPKYPLIDTLHEIDRKTLQTFLRSHFIPSRMTVAGVGVDHDELCRLSEKFVSGTLLSAERSDYFCFANFTSENIFKLFKLFNLLNIRSPLTAASTLLFYY